jgi:hypothetical protein
MYWKLARQHLSLEKLNEILKPNRTRQDVIEPLLKTMYILTEPANLITDA